MPNKVAIIRVGAVVEGESLYRIETGEAIAVDFVPEIHGSRIVRRAARLDLTPEDARNLGAAVVDDLVAHKETTGTIDVSDLSLPLIEQVVLGASLAGYRFDRYRTVSSAESLTPREVHLVASESAWQVVEHGLVLARAVALARDLINEPPSVMTPRHFAGIAEAVAKDSGLEIRVWDEKDCASEGLGGLLGVAKGSVEPPRMVRLRYVPKEANGPKVALVGKGITFDSGGLSLKSGEGMMTMKTDMSGAASVLAAMSVLGAFDVRVVVSGYLMLTENLPSGSAQKPGDVLITRSKQTIEVLNTDAEGRLVLADGLTLAVEDGNEEIVDIATLTGACVVALGDEVAGVMGNDSGLIRELREAGDAAGEPNWELPLPSRYEKHIDSEVADMKNIGKPGKAGTISAALLLQRFVDDRRWAHLDIAGPARADVDRGWNRVGATGFGVMTFVQWLRTK
ncbi:MAG: leucyl aminopeptidase [Ferrimicrobium sp.]